MYYWSGTVVNDVTRAQHSAAGCCCCMQQRAAGGRHVRHFYRIILHQKSELLVDAYLGLREEQSSRISSPIRFETTEP